MNYRTDKSDRSTHMNEAPAGTPVIPQWLQTPNSSQFSHEAAERISLTAIKKIEVESRDAWVQTEAYYFY